MNQQNDTKKFVYKELETLLNNFYSENIQNIVIEILISPDTPFYNDELFYLLCKDVSNRFILGEAFLSNGKKLKVSKIQFMLADSLQRHNLLANSQSVRGISRKNLLMEEAYSKSLKNGISWFSKNLRAINELLPEDNKLTKTFALKKEITTLFDGKQDRPEISLVRYDYWLNHPEYRKTEKALKNLCSQKGNLLEKSFQYEVAYYIERIKKRNGEIEFEELLKKQSYNYLFDETVSFIIKHREQNNLIEFYFGGGEPKPTLTFRGRRAQKDPIIQKYLQNELKGADQRKFVSVKIDEPLTHRQTSI